MPMIKRTESKLDPERRPSTLHFALMLLFGGIPFLAMMIVVPTSSAYVAAIDAHNGAKQDPAFAGVTVSALPLAIVLTMIPLSWLFAHVNSYRFMVWLGIVVSAAGQLMYGLSGLVMNKWYLFGARLVQGAGSYQALRAVYISEMVAPKRRVYYFLWSNSAADCGYVFGNLLAFLVEIVTRHWGGDVFNNYTSPAWFMICLWVIYAVAFALFWSEPTLAERGYDHAATLESLTIPEHSFASVDNDSFASVDNFPTNEDQNESLDDRNEEGQALLPTAPSDTSQTLRQVIVIGYLILSAMIITIISSSFEMFVADWFYQEFGWSPDSSALYLTGAYGVVVAISIFALQPYFRDHHYPERHLMLWPMIACGLFTVFFYRYDSSLSRFMQLFVFSIGALVVLSSRSIPIGAISSLASKLVHPKHVASVQMWVTTAFLFGRAAGPPIGSYASQNLWSGIMTGLSFVIVFATLLMWPILVPIEQEESTLSREISSRDQAFRKHSVLSVSIRVQPLDSFSF
jgi:MFS family permease